MNAQVTAESLKQYYVYELRAPITSTVFYVGKGTSKRAWSNLREEILEEDQDVCGKQRAIAQIRAQNHGEPCVVIVGRFDTPEEAFAVECVLIKWIYGIENLCNLVHGHRHSFVRGYGQVDQHLTGIDVEARERSGEYTARFIAAAEKHDIPQQQQTLIDWFKQLSPNIAVTDPKLGQSPLFYIQYNSDFRLRVIQYVSGTELSISISPAKGARQKWNELRSRPEASALLDVTKEYAWIRPQADAKMSFGDNTKLIASLRSYGDALSMLGENPDPNFEMLVA